MDTHQKNDEHQTEPNDTTIADHLNNEKRWKKLTQLLVCFFIKVAIVAIIIAAVRNSGETAAFIQDVYPDVEIATCEVDALSQPTEYSSTNDIGEPTDAAFYTTYENVRDLFTLVSPYNMTVLVVFDVEPPNVQFYDPTGQPIDMQSLRYRPGSNFTQYFFPHAQVGTWTMSYDLLGNTEVTTPYSVYMEHIFIRDFSVQSDFTNQLLDVTFTVSSDSNEAFDYTVYAEFTDDDNYVIETMLLFEGQGTLNELTSATVDFAKLEGMGGFMVRLAASVQHGQAAIQDTAWYDLRLVQ